MALSNSDIATIKGMIARGDRQSDIAAYFGGDVNSGRVSEIKTGHTALGERAKDIVAATTNLPKPGPYNVSVRGALKARETLTALRELIDETLAEIIAWESDE